MRTSSDHKLIMESPIQYYNTDMQNYIKQEKHKPSKRWIANVIQGLQEKEHIKLDTEDFILLPDTERINRYSNTNIKKSPQPVTMNWLAIVKDDSIETMRDLRGQHVHMLENMRDSCLMKIQEETGINPEEIMVYVHYHPSVYHLHVHFAYPYMQYNHRDIYRIHSINTIIENLKMDPNYYALANIQVSVTKDGPLYKAMFPTVGSNI